MFAAAAYRKGRRKVDIIKLSQAQKDVEEGVSQGKNIEGGILRRVLPVRDFLHGGEVMRKGPPAAAAEEQKEHPDGNWLPYLAWNRLNDVTPRYALRPRPVLCIPQVPQPCPVLCNVTGITQRDACMYM